LLSGVILPGGSITSDIASINVAIDRIQKEGYSINELVLDSMSRNIFNLGSRPSSLAKDCL
jgi:hypothetical protein